LDRLQPGLVVEGQISNIVDFGAFVDLDGIDGLIHISELSWSHVNHPSEILSIGDTVKVKVLDIDRDRQRISLGLKQTQEDPWQLEPERGAPAGDGAEGAGDLDNVPELELSEDVFTGEDVPPPAGGEAEAEPAADAAPAEPPAEAPEPAPEPPAPAEPAESAN